MTPAEQPGQAPYGDAAWSSYCPRCGRTRALDDTVLGCPSCADEGVGMPMVPRLVDTGGLRRPDRHEAAGLGAMWRWAPHLVPVGVPVSLGEGGTPLVGLADPRLPGRVLLKDERANPTGTFKDRLASAAVGRARHLGAETVVVSSSGNAGVSIAAYAAAAGVHTVLLAAAEPGLPGPIAGAVRALGADVCLTRTHADRWAAARTGVERLGWFPVTNLTLPPVASHPAGMHGYRTIAYEIAEALGWQVPDWVVVPVSRGDGLFGIWSGFAELHALGWTAAVPRMLAVVRSTSLVDALRDGLEQPTLVSYDGPVAAASISDPQGTAMSVHAVRASRGAAVACDDAQIRAAWRRLADRGQLVELSSAAALVGATALAERGLAGESSTVVLLVTAGPYAMASLEEPAPSAYVDDPTDAEALAQAVMQRPG